MLSKPVAFGLLAAACVVAAAGGAYFAARQIAAPAPAAAAPAARVATSQPVRPSTRPAAESDAGSSPTAAAVATAASVVPSPPGARRPGAPARESRSAQPLPAKQPATPATVDGHPVRLPTPGREDSGRSDAENLPPTGGATPADPQPVEAQPLTGTAMPVEVPQPTLPSQESTFEELVVVADSVLGLQLETQVSSERAQVEDRVDAKVTRDVRVGERVVIPAGTRVVGSVTQVTRGGKLKERAQLALRFHTLVLANSTQVPINTDPIYRESESPVSGSAAKIGGAAVGGAILGAIISGGRGAAIGGAIGAAGGTGVVMAGDRTTVTLPSGTLLTVRVLSPVTITIEK
jgi:hypothetical protein